MMSFHAFLCRAMRCVWWVSVSWLCLTFLGIVYFFASWLVDKNNPSRFEAGIGSGLILIYSFPAAIGAIAAALLPDTGLSLKRRLAGTFLLSVCVVLEVMFDYFQARYR
jgi:hypothetical protein